MAYISKKWKLNDTVTPDDLNKIEKALEAGEAEKVNTTEYSPSSQIAVNPVFTLTEGYAANRISNGIRYAIKNGTTSAIGTAMIIAGNNTAKGTAGNKTGSLRIYGRNSYYAQIVENESSELTGNRTLRLPNKNGTIALTSDVMVTEAIYVSSFANSTGYVDVAVSQAYTTRTLQITPVVTNSTTEYLTQYAIQELSESAGTFRIKGISTSSGKPVAFNVCYKKA